MAEQSIDRIRAWESRTGGFVNVGSRSAGGSSGAPF